MNGATVREIEPDTQAGESQCASTENIDNGTAVYQDALELKQEVKDENGKSYLHRNCECSKMGHSKRDTSKFQWKLQRWNLIFLKK